MVSGICDLKLVDIDIFVVKFLLANLIFRLLPMTILMVFGC